MANLTDSTEDDAFATKDSPVKPISVIAPRMFLPPVLERKHSSGDLHSRLKTRKILGVGETDNGDIHRSKISQLLGHNEHLYVRFPKGYWYWHLTMALTFTLLGINNLFFPTTGLAVVAVDANMDSRVNLLASRYYGCVSLAVSFMLWIYWGTSDKTVIKSLLTAVALCHILQTVAVVLEHWEDTWKWHYYLTSTARTLLIIPNVYYYRAIGLCGLRMRKSNSFTNLRDSCNTSGN